MNSPTAPRPPVPPLATSSYGGDEVGLICGYLFDPEAVQQIRALGSDEAAAWLAEVAQAGGGGAAAAQGGSYLWLHFNLSNVQAERWLVRHAQLADAFFEALHEGVRSTRIERSGDDLVAVLSDLQFDFDLESSDVSTLWISVGPRLVVTARTSPLRSVDVLRTAVRAGEVPPSSTGLLEHLLRTQADVLVGIVRSVTARIDTIEDELLAGRLDHKRARLGAMRRLLVRLQRLLAPEPAALFRLLQRPPGWMAGADVDGLRGATEEFSLVLRDMQALEERIKLLQEEVAAGVNEENNRSLFVLTMVTVLALPINILTGLFGMNVGGIPLADHPHGFWVLVGVIAAFSALAAWLAFRNKR